MFMFTVLVTNVLKTSRVSLLTGDFDKLSIFVLIKYITKQSGVLSKLLSSGQCSQGISHAQVYSSFWTVLLLIVPPADGMSSTRVGLLSISSVSDSSHWPFLICDWKQETQESLSAAALTITTNRSMVSRPDKPSFTFSESSLWTVTVKTQKELNIIHDHLMLYKQVSGA